MNRKKINLLLLCIVSFVLFGNINVKAWSTKRLVNNDGRYCFYENSNNSNAEYMSKIKKSLSSNGKTLKITNQTGFAIKLVANGKAIKTVNNNQNCEIDVNEAESSQIIIFRDTANKVCRFKETKVNSGKTVCATNNEKYCAIGYINTFDGKTCENEINPSNIPRPNITYNDNSASINIKIEAIDNTIAKLMVNDVKIGEVSPETIKTFTIDGKGKDSLSYSIHYRIANGDCKNYVAYVYNGSLNGYKKNTLKNSDTCKSIKNDEKYAKLYDRYCKASYVPSDSEIASDTEINALKKQYNKIENLIQPVGDTNLIKNTSLSKIKDLAKSNTSGDNLYCQFNKGVNKTERVHYTYEEYEFYVKVCKETIKVEYDTPKLVSNNGGGFKYDVKITPEISCYAQFKDGKIEDLYDIKTSPKCKIKHECYGRDTYYKDWVDEGYWDGGPNEDFDNCVSKCDNGKYTQKCINSCYNSVYKNKSNVLSNNNFLNTETRQIASFAHYAEWYENKGKKWTDEWCKVPPQYGHGHYTGDGRGNTYHVSDHTGAGRYYCVKLDNVNIVKWFMTNTCGSTCYTTIEGNKTIKYEDGKLNKDTLNDDYYYKEADCYIRKNGAKVELNNSNIKKAEKELNEINDEISKVKSELKSSYANANYQYIINDSDKKFCNNGKEIKYSSKSTTYGTKDKENHLNIKVSDAAVVELGFPNTCLKNGTVENSRTCCSTGYEGGNRFYMNLTTDKDINRVYNWPIDNNANFTAKEKDTIKSIKEHIKKISGMEVNWDSSNYNKAGLEKCESNKTDGFKNNIKVNLSNLGYLNTTKWNFNINCFYGYYGYNPGECNLTTQQIDTDNDGQPDSISLKAVCPSNSTVSGGEQLESPSITNDYIFRTVDLSDLFNLKSTDNKNIPWNWKKSETTIALNDKLSNYGYNNYIINPDQTVKYIQDMENYKTAYDYRNYYFDVTKDNMRSIKNYNSTQKIISNQNCENQKGLLCNNKFINNGRGNYYSSKSELSINQKLPINNARDK